MGALARHAAVERSAAVAERQPLLRQALRRVAHPVIRNRGTVVGSLVHADPAAELPAVLALLGRHGTARPPRRARARRARGGVLPRPAGVGAAARRAGGLGVLPGACRRGSGTAFCEIARRHGDYALAGVAALVTLDDDLRITTAQGGLHRASARCRSCVDVSAECARRPAASADWPAVAAAVRDRVEPEDDIHATAEYRRHLTGVLAERALRLAAERASHG